MRSAGSDFTSGGARLVRDHVCYVSDDDKNEHMCICIMYVCISMIQCTTYTYKVLQLCATQYDSCRNYVCS